jgi:hypothetical protein
MRTHVFDTLMNPDCTVVTSCRYGIPVVPAYNMSVPLHDAHNSNVL